MSQYLLLYLLVFPHIKQIMDHHSYPSNNQRNTLTLPIWQCHSKYMFSVIIQYSFSFFLPSGNATVNLVSLLPFLSSKWQCHCVNTNFPFLAFFDLFLNISLQTFPLHHSSNFLERLDCYNDLKSAWSKSIHNVRHLTNQKKRVICTKLFYMKLISKSIHSVRQKEMSNTYVPSSFI